MKWFGGINELSKFHFTIVAGGAWGGTLSVPVGSAREDRASCSWVRGRSRYDLSVLIAIGAVTQVCKFGQLTANGGAASSVADRSVVGRRDVK